MTLHLTSCVPDPPLASPSEMRELERRLERGDNAPHAPSGMKPVNVGFGTREARIIIDALRRVA